MNRRALLVALSASSAFVGTAFAQSSDVRQNEQNIQAAEQQRVMQERERLREERDQRAAEQRRAAEQGQRWRGRDDRGRGDYRGDRRGEYRDDYRNDGRGDYRGDGRGNDRGGDWRGGDRGRGAGPDHNWYRGSRLPPEYRTRQYVVDDWRAHRLSAPPRGYQWVQSGGDYLLVAIATGVIASILLNH